MQPVDACGALLHANSGLRMWEGLSTSWGLQLGEHGFLQDRRSMTVTRTSGSGGHRELP